MSLLEDISAGDQLKTILNVHFTYFTSFFRLATNECYHCKHITENNGLSCFVHAVDSKELLKYCLRDTKNFTNNITLVDYSLLVQREYLPVKLKGSLRIPLQILRKKRI